LPPNPVRVRRNPRWIALGVAAMCLGALTSFFLYRQATHAQAVVAVTHSIYRGSLISRSDLTTITVGNTGGVHVVPASQLSSVTGKRVSLDLVAGSLLSPDAVTDVALPAAKRAIVGIRLPQGRAPEGYLPPAASVRLVAVPPSGADPGYKDAYAKFSVRAKIADVTTSGDGLSLLVNADVSASDAATVGRLAAQERLVLIRDAEE
jgi:SAF domain